MTAFTLLHGRQKVKKLIDLLRACLTRSRGSRASKVDKKIRPSAFHLRSRQCYDLLRKRIVCLSIFLEKSNVA